MNASLLRLTTLFAYLQLLGFATEELSLRVGQTLAGLLNATLGNAYVTRYPLKPGLSSPTGSALDELIITDCLRFFPHPQRRVDCRYPSSRQMPAPSRTIILDRLDSKQFAPRTWHVLLRGRSEVL
jgi:hypothetical protein